MASSDEKKARDRELGRLYALAAVLLVGAVLALTPLVHYELLHAPADAAHLHRVPGSSRLLVVERAAGRGRSWAGGRRVLAVDGASGRVLGRALLGCWFGLACSDGNDTTRDVYDCLPAGATGFAWCGEGVSNVEMTLRRLDGLERVASSSEIAAAVPVGLGPLRLSAAVWTPGASAPTVDPSDGALCPVGRDGNVYRIAPSGGPLHAGVGGGGPLRFERSSADPHEVALGDHRLVFVVDRGFGGASQRKILAVRDRNVDESAPPWAPNGRAPGERGRPAPDRAGGDSPSFLEPRFLAEADSGQPLVVDGARAAFLRHREPVGPDGEQTIVARVDDRGAVAWRHPFAVAADRFRGALLLGDTLVLLFRDQLVALDAGSGAERYRVAL